MQVTREYNHRTFGRIGAVTFVAPDGTFTLNETTLPESSVEHLLTFALQTLQDAYAGAESADEAGADFEKKLEKLLTGTLGTRGTGGGVDELHKVELELMWGKIKARLAKDQVKKVTALKAKDRVEKLQGWWEGLSDAQRDGFNGAAKVELERRRAKPDVDVDLGDFEL